MTNLRDSVVHSLKWVAISKIIIQMFRWIATFWVIRLLVPEDYAVVAISEMVLGYLVAFSSLGLGAPLVSMKIVTEKLKRQMFSIGILVNGLLFVAQFTLAPIIGEIYNNPAIGDVLQASSICYLFAIFAFIPSAMLTRQMKFKYLSLADIVAGLISSTLTISLAIYGAGFWSLIAGYISNELIRAIFLISCNEMIIKPAIPRKRNLPVFFYCLKMSLSELLFHAKDSVDIILVGLFLNKRALGLYNVGLQISSMPLRKIAPPLRKVAFPAMSKLNNQPTKFEGYLLMIQRMSFFITVPIFWGISSISDILVPFALGEKWTGAAPFVAMLCLAMPFRFAEEMLHPILKSLQKGNAIMRCNFMGFIIFATSIYVGIQQGVEGLMMAWVVGLPLIYLMSTYIVCKEVGNKMTTCLAQSFYPILSGLFMLGAVEGMKWLTGDTWWPMAQLVLCGSVGAITYILSIYVFRRSLLTEVKSFRAKS